MSFLDRVLGYVRPRASDRGVFWEGELSLAVDGCIDGCPSYSLFLGVRYWFKLFPVFAFAISSLLLVFRFLLYESPCLRGGRADEHVIVAFCGVVPKLDTYITSKKWILRWEYLSLHISPRTNLRHGPILDSITLQLRTIPSYV